MAADLHLNSFSVHASKKPEFSTLRLDISATGSFHAFDMKFEGSFGGDLESPQFMFETTRSPARSENPAKCGLSFLKGV